MNPQINTGLNSSKSTQAPKEGEITKTVEKVTSQLPSISFLTVAMASMAVSAGLAVFSQKKSLANFVGLWAPTLLIMGLYNKLVKLEGSDKTEQLH